MRDSTFQCFSIFSFFSWVNAGDDSRVDPDFGNNNPEIRIHRYDCASVRRDEGIKRDRDGSRKRFFSLFLLDGLVFELIEIKRGLERKYRRDHGRDAPEGKSKEAKTDSVSEFHRMTNKNKTEYSSSESEKLLIVLTSSRLAGLRSNNSYIVFLILLV